MRDVNMSSIFTLHGTTSTLSIDFTNPIHLNPKEEYGLAVLGFHSYNSVPNIETSGENKFYYIDENQNRKTIEIPTGSYEITAIEDYIVKTLKVSQENSKTENKKGISLKANNNTLQCEVFSEKYAVDFETEGSIGRLLGFSKRLLEPNKLHTSDLPVDIVKVRTIHIDCNITSGAYYKSQPTHTIYEFPITVDPGYAIDETPKNLIYMPINKREIHNLTINILDQNFRPVNFRGEEIIVRLELKRLS